MDFSLHHSCGCSEKTVLSQEKSEKKLASMKRKYIANCWCRGIYPQFCNLVVIPQTFIPLSLPPFSLKGQSLLSSVICSTCRGWSRSGCSRQEWVTTLQSRSISGHKSDFEYPGELRAAGFGKRDLMVSGSWVVLLKWIWYLTNGGMYAGVPPCLWEDVLQGACLFHWNDGWPNLKMKIT